MLFLVWARLRGCDFQMGAASVTVSTDRNGENHLTHLTRVRTCAKYLSFFTSLNSKQYILAFMPPLKRQRERETYCFWVLSIHRPHSHRQDTSLMLWTWHKRSFVLKNQFSRSTVNSVMTLHSFVLVNTLKELLLSTWTVHFKSKMNWILINWFLWLEVKIQGHGVLTTCDFGFGNAISPNLVDPVKSCTDLPLESTTNSRLHTQGVLKSPKYFCK